MKNEKFKVIPNPLEGYKFSFARCHATEAGAYIIGIIIAVITCVFLMYSDGRVQGLSVLKEFYYYPVLFSAPLLLGGLSMTVRIRRVRKIMTEGKKLEGRIVSYRRTRTGGRKSYNTPNNTILNVEFTHSGRQTCAVGMGHKLPEKILASDRCSVYILDNAVFVTGFEMRKKGDPEIEFKMEEN